MESASITGWVMEQLEKVPDVGDSFVMCGWKVTVTATDERRVQEIRVERLENHAEIDDYHTILKNSEFAGGGLYGLSPVVL